MQAIVTGGAIRVGKAISLNLAAQGYDIILIYNSSKEEALETSAAIEKLGKKAYPYQCDISNKANLDDLFSKLEKNHGGIKLLVNNSAIFERYSFLETTEDIFDRHMDINFKAPFFLTQLFERYSNQRAIKNSNIINIIDTNVFRSGQSHFAYLLSKKSLHELTLMSARALAPKIRVNCISIGMFLPSEKEFSLDEFKQREANTPLKKVPALSDLTNAINYLDNSEYLTGQNIFLDSGSHLL